MVDFLTNKLCDYLHSNNVWWKIHNDLFCVMTDSDTIHLAFKIEGNHITTKTSLDHSLAFEPSIAKFHTIKLRLQNFILDNQELIDRVIAINKKLNLLQEK